MNDSGRGLGERETAIPYPLDSGGWINHLGTLAPPSVMLTWTSIFAGFVIFSWLQSNDVLRVWFTIKSPGGLEDDRLFTLLLVGITAFLTWLIAWICRRRPGPRLPRLWALSLALAASVLFVLQSRLLPWEFSTPLLDSASVACFASALSLLPRLGRLHPNSPWTQRVAPWSLALVLALLLPGLWWVADHATLFQSEEFETAVADMQRKARELAICANKIGTCGETLYRNSEKRLRSVIEQARWQESADLLGRSEEFSATRDALMDGLVIEASHRLRNQIVRGVEDWRHGGLGSGRFR